MLTAASSEPAKDGRPTFTLVLRPEPDVADPVRALRALLKFALRRHGLRCTSAREEKEQL
jgi:hypothetical protein